MCGCKNQTRPLLLLLLVVADCEQKLHGPGAPQVFFLIVFTQLIDSGSHQRTTPSIHPSILPFFHHAVTLNLKTLRDSLLLSSADQGSPESLWLTCNTWKFGFGAESRSHLQAGGLILRWSRPPRGGYAFSQVVHIEQVPCATAPPPALAQEFFPTACPPRPGCVRTI